VVGLLRGGARADEVIVYGGHYDHLGIGPAVDGDSIYNGAWDNASGVSVILEVADGFAALPRRPDRSLMFVAIAAEESGLLGAQHFVENPPVPLESIVANLNIDMTHLLGRTGDVEQLGGDRSTLGADLEAVLRPLGMRWIGDPNPEAGSFFRSDHFPFAKAGVPALYFKSGLDVEGRPEGWGAEQLEAWEAAHYHQPSDEYREEYTFEGAEQLAEIAFRLGWRIANAEAPPTWLPTSEFQRK
jgi:Zn-dependent M28 family amino/carboxypeptidase